jgi:hypothetical protein
MASYKFIWASKKKSRIAYSALSPISIFEGSGRFPSAAKRNLTGTGMARQGNLEEIFL